MSDLKTFVTLQGDDLITGSVQDCTPYAERAKALQNEGFHGSGDMRHAASIPFVIIEKYCNTNGITFGDCMKDKTHMRRILNDPSLSAFRIWPGKL